MNAPGISSVQGNATREDACGGAATPPERKGTEAAAQSAVDIYREIIKDNIDYHILKQDMKFDGDRLDEIVDLMLETVCTARKRVRIAGDDYPAELVKSKFMKLDGEHIRFVLDCMRENTTKIRNIKQYLKAALFNAPSTIGNYYTSLVAHDMASGALSPKKPQYGDPDYYYTIVLSGNIPISGLPAYANRLTATSSR